MTIFDILKKYRETSFTQKHKGTEFERLIRLENIPEKAYEYVVNGKSFEWIMERYAVSVDKASLIKNDPNDWSREHKKPRYIRDLLLSIINVSVKSMEIIEKLPKLSF